MADSARNHQNDRHEGLTGALTLDGEGDPNAVFITIGSPRTYVAQFAEDPLHQHVHGLAGAIAGEAHDYIERVPALVSPLASGVPPRCSLPPLF